MVNSVLDSTITYNDSAAIDPSDLNYSANLYETSIYDKTIVFALGKPKYTYIDQNIVYYSIYLVEDDKITKQIGLYEIPASEEATIVDEDGDIDLNKFDKPLLYTFTHDALHNASAAAHASINEVIPPSIAVPPRAAAKDKWVQEYMSSENYNIIDTNYDGNCFFSTLQLALEENGQEMTIDAMREILVENATEELFENYKELYDNNLQANENLTREIKNITKRYKDLEANLKKTKDRNLSQSLQKQSIDIEKLHKTLKNDRKQVREDMANFAFMKDITNLSTLKIKLKTSDYWADTWAISTLERELNIKTIILSELNYRENDIINVIQCGQLNDTVLETRGKFEPTYYVMLAYHGGYHYQLITYNHQKTFEFGELPEEIKQLVADKCLEKIAGPYSLIPDFKDYALKRREHGEAAHGEAAGETAKEAAKEELSSDLYDSGGTVFRFYSKSADKPLPGKGEGEILGPEGSAAYTELARMPQWRKKLSNAWPAEFKLDNHRWRTVEHYYQAAKFKRNHKDFYIQFSLDSPNSSLANDVEMAKAAGSKSGKFKGELVRPKNVAVDKDFYTGQMQGKMQGQHQGIAGAIHQHPTLCGEAGKGTGGAKA